MKILRTLIIVAVVFGFAVSAQAIKVHQRLFMMTNQIEAAHSIGMVEMDEAAGMTNGVNLADGTVAVYTNGLLYVYHTGVWQKVAGQGGTITEIIGDDGITAVKTGESVELDVNVGDGVIIDGGDAVAVGDGDGIVVSASAVAVGDGDGIVVSANAVAVGDGPGLVVNADDVEVGQGDGITVNPDDVAVDDTVLRTFGDQQITGIKTFSDIKVTNLYAINEHVVNITVSNTALVATNLSVQGAINMNGNVITNLAESTDGTAAVTYNQLTNATQNGNSDLIAATNQLSNDLTVYIDGATNQTLIDATTYTDSATNALMIEAEDLFVNEAGDNMTGILGMGGNKITNVATATDGMDAVNYSQLTNAIEQDAITEVTGGDAITATKVGSSVDIDLNTGTGLEIDSDAVRIAATAAGDGLTGGGGTALAVDTTVVRTSGDQTITGVKTFEEIKVTDLYAENEHVVNITVSNMALVATNLSVEGIIDMNGNKITNMTAGTDGMDAVNYTQLTNATQNGNANLIAATNQLSNDLTVYIDGATNQTLIDARTYTETYTDGATNQTLIDARTYTDGATNQTLIDARTYTDSATNALMIEAEDTFVNVAGDDMTGILGLGGNRITNVANAVNAQDAITKAQLDAATNNLAGDVTLQNAYDNGNEIVTAGNVDVVISGTDGLTVSANEGVYISGTDGLMVDNDATVGGLTAMDGGATLDGGPLQVNGNQNVQMNNDGGTSGQINMDGPTGNDSIRVNASGRIEIYSAGSLALEFE